MGMTDVAFLAATAVAVPQVARTLTFRRTNSAAICANRWAVSLRPAVLDQHRTTIEPIKLAEALLESSNPVTRYRRGRRAEKPDRRELAALLPARRKRPCRCRAAEERDELAPLCMMGKKHIEE